MAMKIKKKNQTEENELEESFTLAQFVHLAIMWCTMT